MPEPLTDAQAEAIARVAATADGGCPFCARDLAVQLAAVWPDTAWMVLIGMAVDGEPFTDA